MPFAVQAWVSTMLLLAKLGVQLLWNAAQVVGVVLTYRALWVASWSAAWSIELESRVDAAWSAVLRISQSVGVLKGRGK